MGDLFFNKVAGVVIGAVLAVIGIREVGHLLVPTHAEHELTAENTSYPFDFAAIESGAGVEPEAVDQGPTDYGLLLAAADISNGERVARRCAACHNFEQGGPNSVGPNLWGVVGRPVASHEGFGYSDALHGLGGDWTYERLDHFIESPASYAPGTAMSFRGLGDLGQRIDLIAYLHSLSENPLPFPDPLPAEGAASEDMQDLAEDASQAMGSTADAAGEQAADATAPAEDAPAPQEPGHEDGGH